jgi:hypothetical protein
MGTEIFRFVTIRPPQQIAANSTTSVIDLGYGKSTSVYCVAVIIALAIISARIRQSRSASWTLLLHT